ncbi:hypothetical protein ACMAZE_03960 [Pseudopelagicola sp. nBUS_20]|uniref:hypothetical protein n=1 Tax=Pseudopelagicola sp. nBUS_20 TaxID=3395317 RepID=UPI003EBCDB46
MNEKTLSDAIERANETFPQLWEVGEKQDYLGGFKLYNGSLKYRRMSHERAGFGKRIGVDLLRSNSEALTQVLHPLPGGIHLAITGKYSYKNSKYLPSVAFAETRRCVSSFNAFAKQYTGDNFLFSTLSATHRRLKTSELGDELDLCFKRQVKFEKELARKFGDAVQTVCVRLELPYDPQARTFHPHFHTIATWYNDKSFQVFKAWLLELLVSAGFNSISGKASLVDCEEVAHVVSHIFKTCLAAYKMAQAGHAEEFRLFVGELKKEYRGPRGHTLSSEGSGRQRPMKNRLIDA